MARPSSYPRELRERAIRMVAEGKTEFPSEFAAIEAVAGRLGIGSSETLRKWIRRAEIDSGQRPGLTTAESEQVKALKRENAELRRAIRSSNPRRLFSRRSSTARPGSSRLHRGLSRSVRGRADLQGAVRARLPDRPVDVLRHRPPPAQSAGAAR
jgi:transposase